MPQSSQYRQRSRSPCTPRPPDFRGGHSLLRHNLPELFMKILVARRARRARRPPTRRSRSDLTIGWLTKARLTFGQFSGPKNRVDRRRLAYYNIGITFTNRPVQSKTKASAAVLPSPSLLI